MGRPTRSGRVWDTGRVNDELDLGEAADYILAERPSLAEDDVWAVLTELGDPPPRRTEDLAVDLLRSVRPGIPPRTVRLVLKEWRAYASLAGEPDWGDD